MRRGIEGAVRNTRAKEDRGDATRGCQMVQVGIRFAGVAGDAPETGPHGQRPADP